MTTTNTKTNKPLITLRDGAIKATIWTNKNDEGRIRYSIDISRSYTDKDDKWHDTHYFGRNELLRVARLAGKAYDAIGEAVAADNADKGDSE